MKSHEPIAVADAAGTAERDDAPPLAEGLRRFLDLGVAQLDAGMRESDAQIERLAHALHAMMGELQEWSAHPEQDATGLIGALQAHLQGAIRALQGYDKLTQRLTHVRDGLAIPAEATANATEPPDWSDILEQVRCRYSMVEERVLFDFMMRGLSATEMLKALRSLRAASAPGELEEF